MIQEESKIFNGKTIICTYPRQEQDIFSDSLSAMGAIVLFLPMIEISELSFSLEKQIETYNWLVFTSKNAIHYFLKEQKPEKHNKIAVIGDSTAKELTRFGFQPDFVGSGKSGIDFANELAQIISPGETVLLILGNLAPDTIKHKLSQKNEIDRINVYKTTKPKVIDSRILLFIEKELYDLLIVTSPSAINNLNSELKDKSQKLKIISIGNTTTETIRHLGIEPLATANKSSYEGLLDVTIQYLMNDNKNNIL